ncbi:MAG: sugar ABC transporter permease [Spirochaetaceae bacterium]|nr:sugar ABC transporter permease [Spirochaetaceae bacterium]
MKTINQNAALLKKYGNRKSTFKSHMLAPYIFISPFIISFLVFGLYPLGYSITMSFWKWTTNGPQDFIGFKNYTRLLTTDPFFIRTLWTSFILMITGSGLQHVFAIPLAIFLNDHKIKGKDVFQLTYFLPYITSTVSIVLIFAQLYDENYGWLNYILENWLHLKPIHWLTSPVGIKSSIAIMLNWRFIGWNTLIYVAGLQSIDRSLYEAAEIDGANKFQQAMKITLPLLKPIIFFTLTLSIIGGFQVFDEPFVLLGGFTKLGGPQNAGLTTAFYLMATGFEFGRLGKGSAIAWLMFLVIIVLNIIHKKIGHNEKN